MNIKDGIYRMREWLTLEQPEGTIWTHHGAHLALTEAPWKSMSCSVRGLDMALFVFNRHEVREDPNDFYSDYLRLTEEEVAAVRTSLDDAALPRHDEWNGVDCTSLSIIVFTEVNPTLVDACANYRKQCPKHKTVFCGRGAEELKWGHDEDYAFCTWFKDGAALRVGPIKEPRP